MLRVLRFIGSLLKNFMIVFSFIVSLVLVVVLILAGLFIFQIKHQVATPLLTGLHSSFVGLDQATIDWTIPVRDTIQVELLIPLETNTTVVLTSPVPLNVSALIDLPGLNANDVPATVSLTLPEGLELPVALDIDVPVDEPLDIELDVRAVIPLSETQLHDPFQNLRLLFEPLVVPLLNLPDNFGEAGALVGEILATGELPNLLEPNAYSEDPWVGFSRTAGLGYTLADEPIPVQNQPLETGIVPQGGIPALDEQYRPELYEQGGPETVNEAARAAMAQRGIVDAYYDGDYTEEIFVPQRADSPAQAAPVQPPPPAAPDTTQAEPVSPPDASVTPVPQQSGSVVPPAASSGSDANLPPPATDSAPAGSSDPPPPTPVPLDVGAQTAPTQPGPQADLGILPVPGG